MNFSEIIHATHRGSLRLRESRQEWSLYLIQRDLPLFKIKGEDSFWRAS